MYCFGFRGTLQVTGTSIFVMCHKFLLCTQTFSVFFNVPQNIVMHWCMGTHNLQRGPRNPKQEPLLFPVMICTIWWFLQKFDYTILANVVRVQISKNQCNSKKWNIVFKLPLMIRLYNLRRFLTINPWPNWLITYCWLCQQRIHFEKRGVRWNSTRFASQQQPGNAMAWLPFLTWRKMDNFT